MDIKPGTPPEILETIKKNISLSEEKRRQQRFVYNVTSFHQGNFKIIKNDEFLKGCVALLLQPPDDENDVKTQILYDLCEAVNSEAVAVRERVLTVLSLAGECFLKNSEKDRIVLASEGFRKWLANELELLPGLVVVIKRICDLTRWLLENCLWEEAEPTIFLFYRIHDGSIEKSPAIRSLVSKALDSLGSNKILQHIIEGYLADDDNKPLIRNILIYLETRAVDCLLQRMIQSSDKQERLALIDLIPKFGNLALPRLEACIKKPQSWMVARNVLSVLGSIGNDTCYSYIKEFFRHEDKRVQYECICSVVRIGGKAMVERLLEGIYLVSDDIKIHIIQLLVDNAGSNEQAFAGLCQFIRKINDPRPHANRRIQSAIIAALRNFPQQQSINLLLWLKNEIGKMRDNAQLLLQIAEAQQIIAPQLRHKQQGFKPSQQVVTFDSDPLETQNALSKVAKIEEDVRKLLRTGSMSDASRLLYDQSLLAAGNKDFVVADKLRDRLLEINPMALAEVVSLGEQIERARLDFPTGHHLGVWRELYEKLNTNEFNALYAALGNEQYRKGDIIVQVGETDNYLYFINSGYVGINCLSGGLEIFLKRMGSGSILGADNFFSTSIWTVSLKAMSDVHLQLLEHRKFLQITEKFPGMENSLHDFCNRYTKVPELLHMSGDDRREFPRVPVALVSQNTLFDGYGNKGGRHLRGEIVDISRNGMAFNIKISNKHNARLLLGRQLDTKIEKKNGEVLAECSGIVVGVTGHGKITQNFIVHLKLSQNLTDTAFSTIIASL